MQLETWKVDFSLDAVIDGFEVSVDSIKLLGVRLEPTEFLEQACLVSHPMSPEVSLRTELANSIQASVTGGAELIAKETAEFFKFWNKHAKELQHDEGTLRKEMDPCVEKKAKGKKLVLFGEMLRYYNYPDPGVLD